MLRPILRGALAASIVLAAAPALAADAAPAAGMGSAGTLYVGAERMFGLTFESQKSEQTVGGTTATETTSHTQFGLLWHNPITPYTVPRIGIDYAIIENLTIGGGIGFLTDSSKNKQESGSTTVENDGPSTTGFIFNPRVGYILGVGDKMGLWLRGGLTYYNLSSSSERTTGGGTSKTTNSENGLALSLDPIFVVSPVDHFGFFGGLMLDLPLTGKVKTESTVGSSTTSTENDLKMTNFGLNFGLLGWF